MERPHGWKPMPVLLRIIWILLLIGAVLSIFVMSSVYSNGVEVFGMKVYGLPAINTEFFLELVAPVVLLIAMFKRYRWTWIFALVYFMISLINGAFGFNGLNDKIAETMTQMKDFPQLAGMDEYFVHTIFYWSMVASLIIGLLIDVAIAVVFIARRRYFTFIETACEDAPAVEDKEKDN